MQFVSFSYFTLLLFFSTSLCETVNEFGRTCTLMQVVSGLLIAEVNVKTMCELGSGGVSLVIFCALSTPSFQCFAHVRL